MNGMLTALHIYVVCQSRVMAQHISSMFCLTQLSVNFYVIFKILFFSPPGHRTQLYFEQAH
jgi:hypothetical protein